MDRLKAIIEKIKEIFSRNKQQELNEGVSNSNIEYDNSNKNKKEKFKDNLRQMRKRRNKCCRTQC